MECIVRIRKGQLDYFRKLARATNKEILAYLVGKVVNPELTIVDKVCYTNNYASQTETEVQWYLADYNKIREDAEGKGLRVIGDLHSHPNWWPILSPKDLKSHIADGNRVSGVCSVIKGKTHVFFWIQESSLPCVIEYVD